VASGAQSAALFSSLRNFRSSVDFGGWRGYNGGRGTHTDAKGGKSMKSITTSDGDTFVFVLRGGEEHKRAMRDDKPLSPREAAANRTEWLRSVEEARDA